MYAETGGIRVGKAGLVRTHTHTVETIRHDQDHVLRSSVVQSRTSVVTTRSTTHTERQTPINRSHQERQQNQGLARQVRALELSLKKRFQRGMRMEPTSIPWIMRHSAWCITHFLGESLPSVKPCDVYLEPEDQLKGVTSCPTRGALQETQGELQPKHPQSSAGTAGEDTGTRTTEGEPRLASGEEAWLDGSSGAGVWAPHWVASEATGENAENKEPQYCLQSTHEPITLSAEPKCKEKPEERVTPNAVDTKPGSESSSSAA